MNPRQFLCGLTGATAVLAGYIRQDESDMMFGVDTKQSVEMTHSIIDTEKFKSRVDYPQSRNSVPAQVEFEAELSQPPDTPPEIEF